MPEPRRPSSPPIDAIVPVLRVVDIVRSMTWYRDVLGFVGEAVGPPGRPSFAILSRDGVELMLQRVRQDVGASRSATAVGGGWDVYLRIADAEAAWKAIQAQVPDLAPIVIQEYGCREFAVTDPDGHVLVLGDCT